MPAPVPATPPFPTQLPYPKAEIPKLFGVLDVEQGPNPALHFGLLMPLNWGQVRSERQLVTPQHPFALRTEGKSLAGPAASLRVSVAYVSQKIAPSDWLSLYLQQQGERVLRERHVAQVGGALPDVLTGTGTAGTGRISRWLVLKDGAPATGGAHFFLLQASTPMLSYTNEMATIFFMAISNFRLTTLLAGTTPSSYARWFGLPRSSSRRCFPFRGSSRKTRSATSTSTRLSSARS